MEDAAMGSDRGGESSAQFPCWDSEFGWLPQSFDHGEPSSVVEDAVLGVTGDGFGVVAVDQEHPATGTESGGR